MTGNRKKKRSKITQPNDGASKEKLIAFRADRELAHLLNQVSNKSETITEALREHFQKHHYVTCANCKGRGKVKQLKVKRK